MMSRPLPRRLLLALVGTLALAGTAAHAAEPLRVATDATFPPMEYIENGKRTGFDTEMVEAIGKQLGRPVEWIDIDFKGLIPALVSRRADMAVSAIYITDERRKVVDFTVPYYAGGLVVMTKADNATVKSPADLAGRKVSVQVGTKSVSFLKEKYPQAQLLEVEKNQEMFNLVEVGRTDAAVTGKPAAYQYVRTRPGLKVLPEQLTTEEYGMAIRKDTPELTKAVNDALARMKADGTYAAIVQKWFPTSK
ncbi:amino acid ABC transporter substrate-binding protein (PAAT family) [Pseudacidovorax intermedius]|uniref:Amino acid ABC transporter substrate-binding protein (PAAT family) n=2 Tax=Pseudacidovorax intermedius TaxID=433924 RepID=A0A370FPY7_9BURK|nr:transporter substrate-binding domain-containing protein [Pseudacidovorax intermedius]RDI29115.1 amino acid ABC transporter substrate-binding protein (PAAT family) [Pseudacidovorax intermedius]